MSASRQDEGLGMIGTPEGMEDLVMSEPVNVLMQDPSEAALVAAFNRATLKADDFAGSRWKTQINEVANHTEGTMPIIRHTGPIDRTFHLLLAWWSDHRGSKHVRIRGGTKVNMRMHLSRLDHDERPPLWQVYPERIYRVKRGDAEPVWLASAVSSSLPRARPRRAS